MQDQRQPTPWPYEQTFAARLRELRELRGLSQTALAQRLADTQGVKLDGTAITRMERGSRAVRIGEAAALANVLGVTVDELLSAGVPIGEALRRAEVQRDQAKAAVSAAQHELEIAETRVRRLADILDLEAEVKRKSKDWGRGEHQEET